MSAAGARYAPVGDADWPAEIAGMRTGFAGGLNVYRTMAHHPALLRAWAELREHVVNRSALGRERLEVVILRTGMRLGSDYEWSQHVLRARRYGLDDARIASLRGPVAAMRTDDAVLARAVDDLFDAARLSEASRDAVERLAGREGVLDLIAAVGFYTTLGYILNSFETPLDDDIAAELRRHPLTV